MFADTGPQRVAGCRITHPHKPHPKKPPPTTQFHINQRCTSHPSGRDSRPSQQWYGYRCPMLSPADSTHLIPDDGVLEKAPYRFEASEPPRNCPPSTPPQFQLTTNSTLPNPQLPPPTDLSQLLPGLQPPDPGNIFLLLEFYQGAYTKCSLLSLPTFPQGPQENSYVPWLPTMMPGH